MHTIEEGILQFEKVRKTMNNVEFLAHQLETYVHNVTPGLIRDGSILRRLRKMKENNLINYECINAAEQRYMFL